MVLGSITELYLERDLWGAMEHRIGTKSSLAGHIIPAEDIDANGAHRPFIVGVDVCARNLTYTEGAKFDRSLRFCFTRSGSVNAMIARFSEPAFNGVALSAGAYENFYAIAAALLTHQPLQDYVTAGISPSDDGTLPSRTRREGIDYILDQSASLATSQSIALGSALCNTAGYFMMAHEIGHLALGHLSISPTAHATEDEGPILDDLAESRTLERDADAFAAAATVWWLGAPAMQESWRRLHDDPQWGFRCFLVSAYLLFTLMDHGRAGDPIGIQKTHPAPLVRISSMAMILSGMMDNWGVFKKEEVWDWMRESIRAVEIALLTVGGGIMDDSISERLWEESGRAMEEHIMCLPRLAGRLDRSHLSAYLWAASLIKISASPD